MLFIKKKFSEDYSITFSEKSKSKSFQEQFSNFILSPQEDGENNFSDENVKSRIFPSLQGNNNSNNNDNNDLKLCTTVKEKISGKNFCKMPKYAICSFFTLFHFPKNLTSLTKN